MESRIGVLRMATDPHRQATPGTPEGAMAYIKRERLARGILSKNIAKALEVSPGHYSQMEGNTSPGYLPRPDQLAIITSMIGIDQADVIRAAGYLPADTAPAIAPTVIRHELTSTLRSIRRAADHLISFQDLLGNLLADVEAGDAAHEAQQQPITDHPAQRRRRAAG